MSPLLSFSSSVQKGLVLAGALLSAGALGAMPSGAQVVSSAGLARPLATRIELERDSVAGPNAAAARRRMIEGDFHPGDRFVLRVTGALVLSDTVVVRSGSFVNIGTLPPISMTGLLRSELRDSLQARLDKLVRGVSVVATPLVRVGIVGEVTRPGFYQVPADVPIADVIMEAGGPTPRADLNKARAQRGGIVIWPSTAMRAAFAGGLSLDQLAIGPGDMIELGERTTINWTFVLQTVALLPVLIIAATSIR